MPISTDDAGWFFGRRMLVYEPHAIESAEIGFNVPIRVVPLENGRRLAGRFAELVPLVFAMFFPRLPAESRSTFEAFDAGALTLKAACRALGIPHVARLVPAEAASRPMARTVRRLAPSTFAQCLPEDPSTARQWARLIARRSLPRVSLIWLAHHGAALLEAAGPAQALDVCDFLAGRAPVHRAASVASVIERCERWHSEFATRVVIRPIDVGADIVWRELPAPRPLPKSVRYEHPARFARDEWTLHFVTTFAEIIEEGAAMRHCVGGYWPRVVAGHCKIASLRRQGGRVATIEFLPHGVIEQMRGPDNVAPPPAATDALVAILPQLRGAGCWLSD